MADFEKIREDFPILKDIIYLDSASTSLTPVQVIEVMNDYYLNYNANTGRGTYKIAIKASNKLEQARGKIAAFINSKVKEVVFTKNTTEAINLVANGLKFEKGDNILVSNIEHHSNLVPWMNLKNQGVELKIAPVGEDFAVNPYDIEKLIDENTKLIAITHLSNVFGSLQDIEAISKIARENNIYFLVDGAQSIGHIPIDMKKIHCDFMAFPGHKGLLGPLGTGFLYLKEEIANDLFPTNLGGGTITNINNEEFKLEEVPLRFEGGTQNIPGIIGLGRAIDYINELKIENINKYSNKLTKKLYEILSSIDNVNVFGNPNNIHNTVSFNLKNLSPYDVSKILDETANICLRSGQHCSIPSIRKISSEEGTLRASVHCYNNEEDLDKLHDALKLISQLS
ncbi:MAG: cysteine desulfurase [Methanobrevibacter sp.]|jgi:cysteine desulfurase/selenocysteine lyase|nr:cysteine desulfurase [Methanobrevibacter sp.]